MRYVKAVAPAKVNLALRVGAARSDGFHPLDTVFEALDIFEELEAWEAPDGEISLEFAPGLGDSLPVDSSNLAVRAAQALHCRSGVRRGVHMRITKHIPIAGGMAGGSADAAAALVAINALWELHFTDQELTQIGAEIGSDVPFVLLGGVAHGVNRGEQLHSVPAGAQHGFVMLINSRGLSTPEVFREFDRVRESDCAVLPTAPASTRALQAALARSDMAEVGALMVNDLEPPAFRLRPDIAQLIERLRAVAAVSGSGAESWREEPQLRAVRAELPPIFSVILSGSGPTVAVLCAPENTDSLAAVLAELFPELSAVAAHGPVAGARVLTAQD
ncbi:MAG: 4-(cytidine 5'-diphospho)-2-C-methyl-D-erythritol kinase [Arcanobacterium sp.]|nr:4-(cytidine 5'-diphospho)-2-C-methyl-D-erythritol kinase [Arcanobacterium sp.]